MAYLLWYMAIGLFIAALFVIVEMFQGEEKRELSIALGQVLHQGGYGLLLGVLFIYSILWLPALFDILPGGGHEG